jgi:hypothetical protein
MKTMAVIGAFVCMGMVYAQPARIKYVEKELFVNEVRVGVWVKQFLKRDYHFVMMANPKDQREVFDWMNKLLNDYNLSYTKPLMNRSTLFEELDWSDTTMLLEAVDRSGMKLDVTYCFDGYCMDVELGEEINAIHIAKRKKYRILDQRYE